MGSHRPQGWGDLQGRVLEEQTERKGKHVQRRREANFGRGVEERQVPEGHNPFLPDRISQTGKIKPLFGQVQERSCVRRRNQVRKGPAIL